MTSLDQAYAAMKNGVEAEARQFYRLLADAPLFLLLQEEANGDVISPRVFDLSDGPVILAFDSEERLAEFQKGPLPFASLPGRVIAQLMLGQGLWLGLNLGTGAASETLLPPDAIEHLLNLLDVTSHETEAQAQIFTAPIILPQLDEALCFALSKLCGLTAGAVVVLVTYANGGRGHILALIETAEAARPDLARAMAEALSFAGLEAASLDVTFLDAESPVLAKMLKVGRVYEVQQPKPEAEPPSPAAPGIDPTNPPRLR